MILDFMTAESQKGERKKVTMGIVRSWKFPNSVLCTCRPDDAYFKKSSHLDTMISACNFSELRQEAINLFQFLLLSEISIKNSFSDGE